MADKNRGNPKNETKNRAPRPQPTLLLFFFLKKKKNMMMTVVKKWGKGKGFAQLATIFSVLYARIFRKMFLGSFG